MRRHHDFVQLGHPDWWLSEVFQQSFPVGITAVIVILTHSWAHAEVHTCDSLPSGHAVVKRFATIDFRFECALGATICDGSITNALDNPKSINVIGHTESVCLPPESIPQFFAVQRLQKRLAVRYRPFPTSEVVFLGPMDSNL